MSLSAETVRIRSLFLPPTHEHDRRLLARTMFSAGYLIWISCRPLFRLILCVSSGFALTKADLLPAIAARGTGQILLNITLPSLMASKIIPAFTSQNISALGPLVLVALIYEALGVLIAWVVRLLFWVPHRFRWGIIVAGGWSNWGDIPTAVVMSITAAAPFNGEADQTLSVAYIAGFILVFMVRRRAVQVTLSRRLIKLSPSQITFFPMGGSHMVGLDYVGPDVEPEEVREATNARRRFILYEWPARLVRQLSRRGPENAVNAMEDAVLPSPPEKISVANISGEQDEPFSARGRPILPTSTPTVVSRPSSPPTGSTIHKAPPGKFDRISPHLRTFLRNLFLPGSIAIISAFIIALVPPLKALFVDDSSTANIHIHAAPDGQPPLAFILDTVTFIGAASIPVGLICLGSALARLHVPRGRQAWRELPTGAILALAVGKMLVAPVLGVLICNGLTKVGVIDREDKVLRFVCIFFSCLPTATTQVFVTQVHSGTGTAEHLSAFLIPQYILMLPAMTGVTAYTLQTLF
ncbi:Auxin efflux carrier transmembrane protein [Mycena chlorophos]|uniref:Auxin efflux carrier transmembrane protein n=1 Tax=Mycena chlorophos TaxID=658473 RepID=A0A8H6SS41_MYCCL|nr:Auxin efflux carrier transmembrane protein [Mycena chlorophos]